MEFRVLEKCLRKKQKILSLLLEVILITEEQRAKMCALQIFETGKIRKLSNTFYEKRIENIINYLEMIADFLFIWYNEFINRISILYCQYKDWQT